MRKYTFAWGAGAVLAALVWTAPLPAAVDAGTPANPVLSLVPADAPIVLHIRGFERAKGRLMATIKNAVPDLAPMVQDKLEEAMKEALEGRQIKGVAKDGSIILAFTEMPKPNQTEQILESLVKIIPVTDYVTFRDSILKEEERKKLKADKAGYDVTEIEGKEVYFIDRKGYAIATMNKETATKYLKKQPGLDSKLDKDTARKLLESDIAVYVDMPAVNKEYGGQLKAMRPFLELLLQQANAQTDKSMLEPVFNGVFQFLEDSRTFLVAGEFRPEGLALHVQTRVGADTKINSYLKSSKPTAFKELGTLPAGQLGYVAMRFEPELFKIYAPFLQGTGANPDSKENKAIKAAMDRLAEAGPQTVLMDFSLPIQGVQVWTYTDPVKAAAAQLQLLNALNSGETFQNLPLKEKPVIKPDAQTHRDFKLAHISMKWDYDKLAEKAPQGGKEMAEAMKGIMGEGTNSWMGTDGKRFVQITAKDWKTAQHHLDAFLDGKSPVGKQKAFQDAAQQLPPQATMLTLMDIPLYVQVVAEFVGPILKGQGLPVNIPELKATKGLSYLGMAVRLEPERGSVDLWIPITAVSEVRKMIEPALRGEKIQ